MKAPAQTGGSPGPTRSIDGVELRYLYVGTDDTGAELAAWLAAPGTRLRWRFRHFGADVAAVDTGAPPVVLLADHRPAGSVLPIFAVADLDAERVRLEGAGWQVDEARVGTPDGPACLVRPPSGAPVALLRVDRPDAMDAAYADPANDHRVG